MLNLIKTDELRTAGYSRWYFPESELNIGQLSLGVLYQL